MANGFSALRAGSTSRSLTLFHGLNNCFADLSESGESFSGDGWSAKHASYCEIFRVVPKILLIKVTKIVGLIQKALCAFNAFTSC